MSVYTFVVLVTGNFLNEVGILVTGSIKFSDPQPSLFRLISIQTLPYSTST